MRDNLATIDAPAFSPSGRFLLHVVSEVKGGSRFHSFQVTDRLSEEIYTSGENFDIRHQLFFLWDDKEDIVWVYSGDVGTFFWRKDPSSQEWTKSTYARSKRSAPMFLKRERPQYHRH